MCSKEVRGITLTTTVKNTHEDKQKALSVSIKDGANE